MGLVDCGRTFLRKSVALPLSASRLFHHMNRALPLQAARQPSLLTNSLTLR